MSRPSPAALILAGLALTLSACGGGDDPTVPEPTTTLPSLPTLAPVPGGTSTHRD